MPSDDLRREVLLPASLEDVWAAVIHAEDLSAWFGAAVTLDARPGGRAEFRWADGTTRGAVIEAVEPPRRFSFRWVPFDRGPDGKARPAPPGRVELSLAPEGDGTRLTVTETIAGTPAEPPSTRRPQATLGASPR